jgi:SSS family solute:Na+ symporter
MYLRNCCTCIIVLFVFVMNAQATPLNDIPATRDNDLAIRCLTDLRNTMNTHQQWVKVHAAEYLIWTSQSEGVRTVFLEEEKRFDTQSPYRIGIWRVLAQAALTDNERNKYISKILAVFADTSATDRIHAAETLAKLGVASSEHYPDLTMRAIAGADAIFSIYTRWGNSLTGVRKHEMVNDFMDIIGSNQDGDLRNTAAYAIRHVGVSDHEQWSRLARIALAEPRSSDSRLSILSAALVAAPDASRKSKLFLKIKKGLLESANSTNKDDRAEMCAAIALRGRRDDLPLLVSMLDNKNPIADGQKTGKALHDTPQNADVRAAAAFAILKINKTQ